MGNKEPNQGAEQQSTDNHITHPSNDSMREPTYTKPPIFLDMPPIDISSSQLRKMIAAGKDISNYVPLSVFEYIKVNRLYER
jgi:nicotinic acid mononucleotide adenylyltransferase